MSEKIETFYGGFKISYIEFSNKWRIEDDGEHGSKERDTLTDCKKWIDNLVKQEKTKVFVRQTAIHNTTRGAKRGC